MTLLDYLGVDVALEGSPGLSFAPQLRGEQGPAHRAVFYEQEETRGVRTARYAYWQRMGFTAGTGSLTNNHDIDDVTIGCY